MVLDSEAERGSRWAAIVAIAPKIGCAAQTLNEWCKRAEIDSGGRAGVSTEMTERMKALERENRELPQANEILRKGEPLSAIGPRTMASAYFAHLSANESVRQPAAGRSSNADQSHDRVHP